jgi:glutaredoxin 3
MAMGGGSEFSLSPGARAAVLPAQAADQEPQHENGAGGGNGEKGENDYNDCRVTGHGLGSGIDLGSTPLVRHTTGGGWGIGHDRAGFLDAHSGDLPYPGQAVRGPVFVAWVGYAIVRDNSVFQKMRVMARVKVYSTGVCPVCDKAKMLLGKWGIPFDEVRVDLDQAALREMLEISNHARTVPQIAIDGRCIGGYDELTELHMDGELDELVDSSSE